jgi:GTPase SAR1 family protein
MIFEFESCYIKTTGNSVVSFKHKGVEMSVKDIGGQKSERKKWAGHFTNIDAVIFVAALSQYNQMCYEDPQLNRMKDSLDLLESLGVNNELLDIPFYLYLNKQDVFVDQIEKQNLSLDSYSNLTKEFNVKYNPENKIDLSIPFSSQWKQLSFTDIKVVGNREKLVDLSDDLLWHILSFEIR